MHNVLQVNHEEQAHRLMSSIKSLESLVQREAAQQALLTSAIEQHDGVLAAIDALSAAHTSANRQQVDMSAAIDALSTAQSLSSSSIAAKLETLASSKATADLAAQAAGIAAKLETLKATAKTAATPATLSPVAARVPTPSSARAQLLPPPPPAPRRPVQLVFRFDGGNLSPSAKTASLYWLSQNSSEHLYSEIPRGMQVVETTQPGHCWRVRDSHSGNHLVTRYCASSAPRQDVVIKGQRDVVVEFSFPKLAATSQLTASSIAILEVHERDQVAQASTGSHVGVLPRGGHLMTEAVAGAAFIAVESGTGRVVGRTTLTFEAKQYVTFGSQDLTANVEFVAPRTASHAFSVYHKEADGEEHLRASLKPGEAVRVHSTVGSEWVVREKESDRHVMELTTATAATQQVHIRPDSH